MCPSDDTRRADEPTVVCRIPDWLLPPQLPRDPLAHPHASTASTPVRKTEQRFARRKIVAKGGSATIHATDDNLLLRTIATKVFDPRDAEDESDALRFVEEAQITGQLDHPNIVPVHDLGLDEDGHHFFTMKMVEGDTLATVIRAPERERGVQRLDRLLQIFLKVCDGVSFAHSRGVVHRDLKPDNVMVGPFGQVHVMDWGVAHLLSGSRPSTGTVKIERDPGVPIDPPGTVVGTPSYLSPEQAFGMNADIDQRTDVFGLGAILHEILTGRPPYQGANAVERMRAAQRAVISLEPENASDDPIPPGLARIARKALQADPRSRYQSVEELKGDVEQFIRGGLWFSTQTFEPGTVIVRQDDDPDAAYIVISGECEAFRSEGGTEISLRTMGPGDVFGETAIFAGSPRTASVRAITALAATVVSRASLEQQLGIDSWVGSFVKAVAGRFREIEARDAATRVEIDSMRAANRELVKLLEQSGIAVDTTGDRAALRSSEARSNERK